MPDIVITPNRGTSNNPKIDFTGTSAGTIKLEVLGDGTIAWNGANGSLFSIADSLSGSLMSVNDISGLPAFEVFSDNRVVVGQFGANLLLGKTTSSSNGRLQLTSHTTNTGGIGFGSDVTLFRSAADILRTEDSFYANGEIYAVATGGGLKFSASSTTGLIVALQGGGIQFRNSSNANLLTLADAGNVIINSGTLVAGNVGTAIGAAPIVVNGTVGDNDSHLIIKKPSQSSLSFLAWDGGTYIATNTYYENGTWIHNAPAGNTNSQLLNFIPGTGVKWWTSNNSTSSWNVSSDLLLWNDSGVWQRSLSNTLTLATSGTGLSGSATYNNSGAVTFTVTSNATSANTASTIVARDGSGNFSAGTITASNVSTTTLTQGGTSGHITKEYTFNLSAQSNTQFFPIRLTGTPIGAGGIHTIEVLMDSFTGGDPYNHHSVHGQVRGSGWTDLPAFYDVFHNCYQDNERSYLGFFKGTQNCTDVILYVRGGKTYYVKTPSTASVSTTALTISDSVFAIKDSNAADVSGTSANVSFMLNLITAAQGRQTSNNLVVSGSMFAAGGNTVWHAGNDGSGSGLDADLLDGYNQDTANTASAIVRRDGSGFINATAIQTSSGGSNGVRVHTNSGITASNNYMNFFTSQTSGWAFNANGTGADTNNVAVVTSGGNVGIGQTSPLQTLQLKNNGWIGIGASTGSYIPTSWQRGGNGGIILSSSANADGSGWSYGSRLVQVDYGNGLGLSIDVNYASSWTNDALFISGRSTSLGNVGIGTTDPAAKLDVNGSFKHGLVYRYPHSQIAPALNSTGWLKLATIPNNSRAKFLMRNGSANSEETLEFDVYSTYFNSGVYVIVTRNTYNYHLNEIQVQGTDGQPRIVYVKCRTSDYAPTFTWQVESWNGAATIHNTEETPTSGKNFVIGTSGYLHSNYVPNVYFDGNVGIGKIPSTKFNIKEQNTGTEGFIIANWNNVNTVLVGSDASTGGGKFTLKNNSGTANIFINSAGDSYLNGGNVGIGTTSPSAKLDVYYENSINTTTPGMTMYNLHLTPSVRTAGNAVGITFGADTGSGTTPQAGIYSQFSGSYGTKMYFATTDAYVSGAKTRMVIDHNGYLSTPTGSQLSYQDSTTYIVWSSEPEYSVVDDATDSNYKVMKTFVAEKSGSLRVKFSAYIISGTYYWAWRIRKANSTVLASGNYANGLDTGEITSVHAYRRFSALISVNPGDVITVEMVSSDGSGNPVNGNGQTLYLKELRIYNSIPESTYGSSNVFGDYVGIGTTAPTSRLEVNGTTTTSGAVINYPYGDAFPLQLTGTSFLKANANYYGMLIRSGDANYLSGVLRIVGGSNKRVELYSYEETVGAKNVVFPMGNVGVNEVNPTYKLHVSGDAYISTNLHANGTLRAGNVETASFATAFTHNVANRATDIRFPNTYINGLIEIEVTSSYSNQNSVGVVKKIFSVGANPNNTIWNSTIARVVEAHGAAADNWTIGDFAWDATNSCYIIPVYHIVSTGNTVNINIRYFSQIANSNPILITTTVSAEYTATIPAAYQTRHYVYYNDRLGIGTSAPSTLFQVAGNNVGNFRLDTNGSGGHYYQTESNARLGLGRDLITSAGHISFTMAGGSVNTLGAAITMPANSQLGFYTSNGSSLIERVRIDGSGNVGVNSTNPSTLLNVQGSFATRNFKVFTWSTLSANATQARRYEIARLGHDTVNWDSTGVFEVEIYQQYYSRPVKKRYMVSYGYPGGGVVKLVEYQNSSTSGYGANNFQITLGTEVVTPVGSNPTNSPNIKYLPVYIDIRYYAIVDVRVTTNWNHSTTNSTPGSSLAYINEAPSPTNISDFGADSVVWLTSDNDAVFGSNLSIYGGETLYGNLTFGYDQTAYYIKGPANGGAIRIRSNSAAATDRDVQLGKIDNSGNWSSYMTVADGGNVGIGTTSPSYKLHVEGDSYSSTGFYVRNSAATFIGSVNNMSGMSVNGTSYDTLIYSGGNQTITVKSGGNVGIGNTNPTKKLKIGSGTTATVLGDDGIILDLGAGGQITSISSTNVQAGIATSTSFGYMGTWSNHPLYIRTNNSDKIIIESGGNIGIGLTSNIRGILHVNGSNYNESPTVNKLITVSDSANSQKYMILSYHSTPDCGVIQGLHEGTAWKPVSINPIGANVGIGTTSPSYKLDVNGDARVTGTLIVQDGTASTNVFGLTTFTKSLTVTTSWSDVGISGSDLATGSYIIQVLVDNYDVSGGQYSEYYTGFMSWTAGGTNSTDVDEIVLHKAGHAPNTNWINLRTVRQLGSGAGVLKLQIIASGNTSAADNYIFKFRRMI